MSKHGDLMSRETLPASSKRTFKTKLVVNKQEAKDLKIMGEYLHSEYAKDFNNTMQGESRTTRKKALTVNTSSRWAGSITRVSQDQYELAGRNNQACLNQYTSELGGVEKQLAKLASQEKSKLASQGKSKHAVKHKQFDLQKEKHRLETLIIKRRKHEEQNHYPTVLGGSKLFKKVCNGNEQAKTSWSERRLFLTADGESGAPCGNQTIKINKQDQLVIKIPKGLQTEYPGQSHYQLKAPVILHQGEKYIRAHIAGDLAVSYTIRLENGVWLLFINLDIARTCVSSPHPTSKDDQKATSKDDQHSNNKYTLGVDLNADHLAAWRIDQYGNPVGEPKAFHFATAGSSTHSQAQVLHALDQLFHYCKRTQVHTIALEDLQGFTGAKSRNSNSKGKRFRRLVSNMPVALIQARLRDKAYSQNIKIIRVNPAYTSQLAKKYWLSRNPNKTSRNIHFAAAIVIARRSLGYQARCKQPITIVEPVEDTITSNGLLHHPGLSNPPRGVSPEKEGAKRLERKPGSLEYENTLAEHGQILLS
jgi:IS605 OrfB family transposase